MQREGAGQPAPFLFQQAQRQKHRNGDQRPEQRAPRALLNLRQGDTAKARENLTMLADDPKTPSGVRARAVEMLRTLKQ